MRRFRIRLTLTLLLVCTASRADVFNNPVHPHGDPPICTWPPLGCAPTGQHQHRTAHDPAAGVLPHGGVDPYIASKSWQNDRTLHSTLTGHAVFAHGHVDAENAIRYLVQSPTVGGDVSASEKALWDANVPAMAASIFDQWTIAGSLSGAKNWSTDNDHVPGDGVPWHSSLTFVAVTSGPHEIDIVFGEAGAGNAGVFNSATRILTIDDDQDWYWGNSTDTSVEPTKLDLYSVLLHEAGHVAAFGHFGTLAQGAVMNGEAQPTRGGVGGILHTIDASAVHGALDVYAIPDETLVPGVGGAGLVVLGSLMLAVTAVAWRRTRAAR